MNQADFEVDPFDLEPYGVLQVKGEAPVRVDELGIVFDSFSAFYAMFQLYVRRTDLAITLAEQNLGDSLRAFNLRLHEDERAGGASSGKWSFPSWWRLIGVPPNRDLVLRKVELSSPGFWVFAGTLSPLGQVRGYLAERHERKKDKEYRNANERRLGEANARLSELEVERAAIKVEVERYEAAARIVGVEDARHAALRSLEQLGIQSDRSHLAFIPESLSEEAPPDR